MTEPLPLYARTSAAWADAMVTGRDPIAAARDSWASGFNFDQEDRDPEHLLVFGGEVSFDDLLVSVGEPRADEVPWQPGETTRLGVYAGRLWGGLLGPRDRWSTSERADGSPAPSGSATLRRVRGAAPRDDLASGQRGDRKDLHHRRPDHALRRRRHSADRPAPRDHLHPHGDG